MTFPVQQYYSSANVDLFPVAKCAVLAFVGAGAVVRFPVQWRLGAWAESYLRRNEANSNISTLRPRLFYRPFQDRDFTEITFGSRFAGLKAVIPRYLSTDDGRE